MREIKSRKNIRLKGYDYSLEGYYFITICVKNRLNLFWENVGVAPQGDPQINLTRAGLIVQKYIKNYENINDINIDDYIIMPNHIHMIINLDNGSPRGATPTIPKIINSLKSIISKEIGYSIWQRNYYEHIIRNEKEYFKIKEYIINNPYNWEEDEYY